MACRRHKWMPYSADWCDPSCPRAVHCELCNKPRDETASRRGRNNAARGKRHSLDINRKYGMLHVENDSRSGKRGPIDGLGSRWKQQNKSKQAQVPVEWALAFAGMEAVNDGRLPRLVIRYLPGPGIRAQDFIVIRGDHWLDEFGPDTLGDTSPE